MNEPAQTAEPLPRQSKGALLGKARSAISNWGPPVALALLVMGLVGLGARKLPGSGSTRQAVAINFDLQQALTNFFLTVGGITAFLVLIAIFWPGQEPLDFPKRSLLKYLVGPLLIVGIVALLVFLGIPEREPALQTPTADNVVDVPPRRSPSEGGSTWGFLALIGTMGLALFVIARRRPGEPESPGAPDTETELEFDVGAFIDVPDDFLRGDDPRARVIRAYSEMIGWFARRQVPRLAAETPREFLDRALRTVPTATDPALRLTHLFEVARFSQHPLRSEDAEEAQAAAAEVQRRMASQ